MNQAAAAATQPALDPSLTLALAVASKAAYDYYGGKPITPPPGYVQVDAWTGWDAFLFTGSEEKYGLVFRNSDDPGTYIFAFRGTDSDLDAYEDAHFLEVEFLPTQGSLSPPAHVAAGFYGIYDGKGDAMTQSMREQLFALIEKYQPQLLYVTGHSLGAALSQLFSLDLTVSEPRTALNLNFSSPMVGTASWQVAYAARIPDSASLRVYNFWDYVPSLPPSDFGFLPVGASFRTAFYVRGEWFPHAISRHSIVNLTTVLSHALPQTPQQWSGTFADYVDPSLTMRSTPPPAGADMQWADRMGSYMAAEGSLREI
ncbi:lipase family protein [Lysobacter silvisoli]|uniref:lipase family protein n=1 Tax=Lysobacter silvisoli TaxID=2293254 RepID=UPI001314243A|nr:lipase family protein [Lysobacter silvisoli]